MNKGSRCGSEACSYKLLFTKTSTLGLTCMGIGCAPHAPTISHEWTDMGRLYGIRASVYHQSARLYCTASTNRWSIIIQISHNDHQLWKNSSLTSLTEYEYLLWTLKQYHCHSSSLTLTSLQIFIHVQCRQFISMSLKYTCTHNLIKLARN